MLMNLASLLALALCSLLCSQVTATNVASSLLSSTSESNSVLFNAIKQAGIAAKARLDAPGAPTLAGVPTPGVTATALRREERRGERGDDDTDGKKKKPASGFMSESVTVYHVLPGVDDEGGVDGGWFQGSAVLFGVCFQQEIFDAIFNVKIESYEEIEGYPISHIVLNLQYYLPADTLWYVHNTIHI
jgi:hypothetical protein